MERDARIDAAVADVCEAEGDRVAAVAATESDEQGAGTAVVRLLAEGLTVAQAAALCDLARSAVSRLKTKATTGQQAEDGGPGFEGRTGGDDVARADSATW